MEYKHIRSTPTSNKGVIGKWYHGRFYPRPDQNPKPLVDKPKQKDYNDDNEPKEDDNTNDESNDWKLGNKRKHRK